VNLQCDFLLALMGTGGDPDIGLAPVLAACTRLQCQFAVELGVAQGECARRVCAECLEPASILE
jgi:hypothetical protein